MGGMKGGQFTTSQSVWIRYSLSSVLYTIIPSISTNLPSTYIGTCTPTVVYAWYTVCSVHVASYMTCICAC